MDQPARIMTDGDIRKRAAVATPTTLRRATAQGDVQLIGQRTPYAGYFRVDEYDLRFRRSDHV